MKIIFLVVFCLIAAPTISAVWAQGIEQNTGSIFDQILDSHQAKTESELVLDKFPANHMIGDTVQFSGSLNIGKNNPEGLIVSIYDKGDSGHDILLTQGIVDRKGKFVANWDSTRVDLDNVVDVYAVFEGNDKIHSTSTCNQFCTDTVNLFLKNKIHMTTFEDSKFLKLNNSMFEDDEVKVLVTVGSDNPDTSRKYIAAAKKSVQVWQTSLSEMYPNGSWNIEIDVVPEYVFYVAENYDVKITLYTQNDILCQSNSSGHTDLQRLFNNEILIDVVVSDPCNAKQPRSQNEILSVVSHEFGHALGLGHAYDVDFDLMCSSSCQNNYLLSTPSDLDVYGLGSLYGSDGFKTPNTYLKYFDSKKFYLNDMPKNIEPIRDGFDRKFA